MSRFMTELESALGSNAAADMKEDGFDDSDWETESGTCYFFLFKDGKRMFYHTRIFMREWF
jgi:hypothetical protein